MGRSVMADSGHRATLLDPPVRADGNCFTCGKPRKPERSRRYAKGKNSAKNDPFCSANCCRRHYGLPLPEDDVEGNVAEGNRLAVARRFYSMVDAAAPVGEAQLEAKRRDAKARRELGLPEAA